MKYGFLFGAGAEVGYGLPSGGKFALDIFRHDVTESKKAFKEMRDNVDYTTRYASYWLPDGFRDKNISSFGKTVFQNIIKDTVEHNRENIIKRINNFDEVAKNEASMMKKDNIDIDALLEKLIGRKLDNVHMGQTISFIDEFKQGNDLFNSSYFSALAFLNGSTETWYDPYLNRIGTKSELTTSENHILVPLMFTQSGTKPMTSIEMSMKYVDTYTQWKNSDRVIIVGFGFGTDDEHINGILRTLIDVDNKEITVVTLDKHQSDDAIAKDIARKLKVTNVSNISIIQVDVNGINIQDKKIWTDALSSR